MNSTEVSDSKSISVFLPQNLLPRLYGPDSVLRVKTDPHLSLMSFGSSVKMKESVTVSAQIPTYVA